MYSAVTLTDALGIDSVELDATDLFYPLQKLDWDYDQVGTGYNKPFSHGRWTAWNRVEIMNIHCEGEILADTITEYWQRRMALMNIAVPNPVQIERNHARLTVTLEGEGSTFYADVQLQQMDAPIAAVGGPTISPFLFEWTCDLGYWTNNVTGQLSRI